LLEKKRKDQEAKEAEEFAHEMEEKKKARATSYSKTARKIR